MRIVFMCSSLAPGRDGVGDYARRLAAACAGLGHDSALLALNDPDVREASQEQQVSQGLALSTLRLPRALPWAHRITAANHWLQGQRPEWLSLQFVPYGYHPKGFIGDLHERIQGLAEQRKIQIMFHELWIGMRRAAPLKDVLVGSLQRRAILRMIRHLRPDCIHTSNSTYQAALLRRGVRAEVLPLPGNIPVVSQPDLQWLGGELVRLGVPVPRAMDRARGWRFGFFGSIHPSWEPSSLLELIAEASRQAGREVVIVSVGRQTAGDVRWKQMERDWAGQFSFAALGERVADEISTFLQSIDFGIAPTPWQLIGKSGAAAAMIDHGVPVIVAGGMDDYGGDNERVADISPLLYRLSSSLSDWIVKTNKWPPAERLGETARDFITALENSAPK